MAIKHEIPLLAMLLLMIMVRPGGGGLSAGCGGDGEVPWPASSVFRERPWSYSCNQTYGLLPGTATAGVNQGNILHILLYVSLLMFAAKLLYDASAILVEFLSPGITGGLFLPLLTSILDAVINLASRQCGSKQTAQKQAISLLTGSTAVLLILLGGSCIIVDRGDPGNSMEKASGEPAARGSAVRTDIRASYTARIMLISVMPFIILQLAQVLQTSSPICCSIFVLLVVSDSLLLAYCHYQVFRPSILRGIVANAKQKYVTKRNVEHLKHGQLGRLLTSNGKPDVEVMRMIFQIKDKDSAVGDVMTDGDSKIHVEVSGKGIRSKWINKAKISSAVNSCDNVLKTRVAVEELNPATNRENKLRGMPSVAKIRNPKWRASEAVLMLVLGSLMAATFSVPLDNAVEHLSSATSIPSFFVSFVVLPFASFSEAVSTQIFASESNSRIAPYRLSKIYGAVNVNNFLCLSVFLGLLYIRHLTWNFTCEVLIVLIIWSFLPREYG